MSNLSESRTIQAIMQAITDSIPTHAFANAIDSIMITYVAPSTVYRPKLSIDGNQWCALYGDDLQNGVAGFGDSPAEAMTAFDAAWHKKLGAQ